MYLFFCINWKDIWAQIKVYILITYVKLFSLVKSPFMIILINVFNLQPCQRLETTNSDVILSSVTFVLDVFFLLVSLRPVGPNARLRVKAIQARQKVVTIDKTKVIPVVAHNISLMLGLSLLSALNAPILTLPSKTTSTLTLAKKCLLQQSVCRCKKSRAMIKFQYCNDFFLLEEYVAF